MNRSRVILLTVALLAGLGSAVLTFQAARELQAPVPPLPTEGLVAVENPLNMGDIPQDTLDGTFKLVNRAEKPVRIVRVAMSCRCTEIDVPNKEIAPGETVELAFKWDTTGVRGIRGSGFTVFYTEKGQDELKNLLLAVRGDIQPLFDLVLPTLAFSAGKMETKTVRLEPRESDTGILLENVLASFPSLQVERLSDKEFSVTFLPEQWTDDPLLRPYVRVGTNCDAEKSIDLAIVVRNTP